MFKICVDAGTESANKEIFNYHQADFEKINNVLDAIDWDEMFVNKNVESMWSYLVEKLVECRSNFVPMRKLNKGKYPKWMKKSIKRKIKTRIKLWKRFNDYPTLINEAKFKKCRNEINTEIRKAKINFETKLADNIKEDPKSFYAYVRSKSKARVKIGPIKDNGGKIVSDNNEMANIFNEYFSSVFTKENLQNMPVVDNTVMSGKYCVLDKIEINQGRIVKAIGTLKMNRAAGVDGLNSSFVKGCAKGIIKPLELIFKKSLDSGEIPTDWKKANVSVIFKKGSKKEPGNYRPVSLTCHLGKILEKIIKEDIVKYLEDNKLIFESQHGFRNKKSCLTNLLEFTKFVSDKIDEGKPVDVIYLDFQKAFDKVPHERLLIKLAALGVGGVVLNWIREWLNDRKQRVIINGEESTWVKVTSGVPQGSVLGPVLFLVFINDLDINLIGKIVKFADDAKLAHVVDNVEGRNKLREDLSRLFNWSEDWQMLYNLDKCKIMHIGNKNEFIDQYAFGGQILKEVEEESDLGVIMNNRFKVDKQCAKVAKKANQILGLIYRTFTCKSKKIMTQLYKSLVRPHMDYCSPAWRPYLKKDINMLEKVQKRATRMVEGYRGLDYYSRLKGMKLTTLETRRLRADLLEVFKIVNGLEGLKEEYFFEKRQMGRGACVTRSNAHSFFKKRFRLDVVKYSFSNRVVNDWNGLPNSVIQAKSVNAFKGKLDGFLKHVRGLK